MHCVYTAMYTSSLIVVFMHKAVKLIFDKLGCWLLEDDVYDNETYMQQ